MLELLTLISHRQFMLTINSVLIYSEKSVDYSVFSNRNMNSTTV